MRRTICLSAAFFVLGLGAVGCDMKAYAVDVFESDGDEVVGFACLDTRQCKDPEVCDLAGYGRCRVLARHGSLTIIEFYTDKSRRESVGCLVMPGAPEHDGAAWHSSQMGSCDDLEPAAEPAEPDGGQGGD